MTTELAHFIQSTPLCSTHEHLEYESMYTAQPPDILRNLFHNCVPADLVVSGASPVAVEGLLDQANPDIAGRFAGIAQAWNMVQQTGYGEAVRIIAREFHGLEMLAAAAPTFGRPGKRLCILRELANLDHVQIDALAERFMLKNQYDVFALKEKRNLLRVARCVSVLANRIGVANTSQHRAANNSRKGPHPPCPSMKI